jgi:hypothetical protein
MNMQPPAGSGISIRTDGTDPTIVIPNAGSPLRYLMAAFLLFWLGMWFVGFRDAASKIIAGDASGFLIFWLGGWTIGGVLAAFTLYRFFRPTVPESLELKRAGVVYDSGIPPLQFAPSLRRRYDPRHAWNSAFPKRVRVTSTGGNFNRCVYGKLNPVIA